MIKKVLDHQIPDCEWGKGGQEGSRERLPAMSSVTFEHRWHHFAWEVREITASPQSAVLQISVSAEPG